MNEKSEFEKYFGTGRIDRVISESGGVTVFLTPGPHSIDLGVLFSAAENLGFERCFVDIDLSEPGKTLSFRFTK